MAVAHRYRHPAGVENGAGGAGSGAAGDRTVSDELLRRVFSGAEARGAAGGAGHRPEPADAGEKRQAAVGGRPVHAGGHQAAVRRLPAVRAGHEPAAKRHGERRAGADARRADENRADHQRVPRHQDAVDLHCQLRGSAEEGGHPLPRRPAVHCGAGPAEQAAEKADGGSGGGVQGVLRRAAGGRAAHRCERAVQPDRRRVSGSAGGLPSDAGDPVAGGAARGGRRQQAAQPRHGQSGIQHLQIRHAGDPRLRVRRGVRRADGPEFQECVTGRVEHLPRRADGALCARGRLPPHRGQRAGAFHRAKPCAADGRHVPAVHRRRSVPSRCNAAAGPAGLTVRERYKKQQKAGRKSPASCCFFPRGMVGWEKCKMTTDRKSLFFLSAVVSWQKLNIRV